MVIENGNMVFVHYTGTLGDGTEFDSSYEREPLEFVVGSGTIIPGFEKAVLGKTVGDKVKTTIPAAEAYGEKNPELIAVVPRAEVPDNITPEVGMMLQVGTDAGDMDVTITRVNDKEVELDANHPLAGQELTFVIEVVKIGK